MPLYFYYVEDPRRPVEIDPAAAYIEREFPAWTAEPKIDRCRFGTPLCKRPVFASLLMRIWAGDRVVLPTPIVLYGATVHDLKSLFYGWRERWVYVDILWGDKVESTKDPTFVRWLLENWEEIERSCRKLLAKPDEEATPVSPKRSKVDQRELVLTEWLVRMKDRGVTYDGLYFALLAGMIRRPNGREYSRGAIQFRVEAGRARRNGADDSHESPAIEDSPAIASLRLKLRELETTQLACWLACPAAGC